MTNFTDQKPRIVTEKDIKAPWRGCKNGECFRCYLCGHKFEIGDIWRWVSISSKKYPGCTNFLVCENCDGDDVKERWKNQNEEAKNRFWWFRQES